MKKSYIVAIIILGVIVLGMLGYGWYTSYGPGSDKAQVKKRVEYCLESCGGINHNRSTWSTYKPEETDLELGTSAINLCSYLDKGDFEDEELARQALLMGVIFDIDEVNRRDDTYIVTVELKRVDGTTGKCYFIFDKKFGSWDLNKSCLENAVYVGNGYGGDSGDLMNLVFSLLEAL
ncbi:MAG: hypothetical protein IJL60_05675 [Clostridiales bacterium]|nr:hypothetical protein [Clostridiales bacterium]